MSTLLFLLKPMLLASMVFLVACAESKMNVSSSNQQPAPKKISAEELKQLRWIEGSWRGSGGGLDKPFFERYKFENDTTLAVESFDSEKLDEVTGVSKFELKEGNFGSSSGDSGSVAVELTDSAVTFAPLGKARNSFRWQRESADSWKAILAWRAADGSPRERVYQMERWPKP